MYDFEGNDWYSFTVDTEDYSEPETPLDVAMRSGAQVGWASNFGQSASQMRIAIRFPVTTYSSRLWWWGSDWTDHGTTLPPDPAMTIDPDERGEDWSVEYGQAALDAVDRTVEAVEETAEDVGRAAGSILTVAVAAGIALFLLGRAGK